MRRSRLAAIGATVVAGVVAAVAGIVANHTASAAEIPPDVLAVIGQRMPIAAGQGGIEFRIAIVKPARVGDPTITNADVTFTVSAGVTVNPDQIVHEFDPAQATAPAAGGPQRRCGAARIDAGGECGGLVGRLRA